MPVVPQERSIAGFYPSPMRIGAAVFAVPPSGVE